MPVSVLETMNGGALTVNLAPPDKYPERVAAEKMVGRPGTGGPTSEHPTGYMLWQTSLIVRVTSFL